MRFLNFEITARATRCMRETVQDFSARQGNLAAHPPRSSGTNQFSARLWPQARVLGLLGITSRRLWRHPDGLTWPTSFAIRKFSRASASVGLVLRRAFETCASTNPPQRHAAQKKKYLAASSSPGAQVGALASPSPVASGSDVWE